jgi:ParB-like nuclease domain
VGRLSVNCATFRVGGSGVKSNAMKIAMWPVDKPVPYPKNARKISDEAVEKVASSIQAFGFRQPIVVDKEGVIVVGHARLLRREKARS